MTPGNRKCPLNKSLERSRQAVHQHLINTAINTVWGGLKSIRQLKPS